MPKDGELNDVMFAPRIDSRGDSTAKLALKAAIELFKTVRLLPKDDVTVTLALSALSIAVILSFRESALEARFTSEEFT